MPVARLFREIGDGEAKSYDDIEGLVQQRAICIWAILRKLALKIFCCTANTDSQTVFFGGIQL